MIGKFHSHSNNKILAVCDANLVGTKIICEDFEIFISSSFFGTEKITEEKILEFIEDCDSANIFGKKVCDLLLEKKIITNEQIIFLNEVPHVQIYKI